MAFLDPIEDLLVNGSFQDIKTTPREIHTEAVEAAIAVRGLNRIVNTLFSDFYEEEVELSRGERAT